jgi:secreted Zn-dependent insulinase-like peptidase
LLSDLLSDCASYLNEDSVNIFLLAREYKDICGKTERWFRTNYADEDIPSEWKAHWKSMDVYPELFLPSPNRFIAEDTSLKPPSDDHEAYPVKIVDDAGGELYFRQVCAGDQIQKQNFRVCKARPNQACVGFSSVQVAV